MKKNNSNKFAMIYERERKIIDKKLAAALKKRAPQALYNPVSYILESSGKRLRPLLVILSARAVGGKPENVYNAAVAVEMLHNFTLIHDDIMDNADLRRGNLTLHKKYNVNTAILAGDALLAVAYEFLLKDCKVNARKALSTFTHGLVEVCEGQSYDTEFENRSNVSLKEYIEMISKKTAALAKMCCELGGYLSDAKPADIKALSDYGKYLGIAFQIQDDLLDIIADKSEFGKKIGGDLLEGKKTYLFIKANQKALGKDKAAFEKVIKNKGIKEDEIEFYKNLYIKLGVIDDAKNAIRHYTKKSLKAIDKLSRKKEIETFYWLADSLLKRNK